MFNGFEHDAAGNLVVVEDSIASGLNFYLAGDLLIGDTLKIIGQREVHGRAGRAEPLELSSTDGWRWPRSASCGVGGGFRIGSAGLVAWVAASGSTSTCPGSSVDADA